MFKSGIANLPLHGGSCPRWLFPIMKKLGGAISGALIYEYGQQEFLKRLADPYWLQSFGSVIGFDWHSSGLTTTTLGALKESINNQNLGIKIAGGKGNESKKVLEEIENSVFNLSENKVEKLKYSSRMSAKVDNCLMQDGYQLYHHSFVFDEKGNWVVVQQGMNSENKYARRYHWLSGTVSDFVEEPHNALCCDSRNNSTLDLTSRDNYKVKKISVDLVNDDINNLNKYFNIRIRSDKNNSIQKTIYEFDENAKNQTKIFTMAPKHTIIYMDKRNIETLKKAHEFQPQNYEELVSIKGIGAKTIRSLALVSELIYGTEINWKDPVKYSFAHGGKDGIPYPVDRKLMDDNTEILRNAIKDAKLGNKEKLSAIGRLGRLYVS